MMSDADAKVFSKYAIEQDDGILITIDVKPGSKTNVIEGVDGWRGCLKIRVKARAEKGRANKELIRLLSSLMSLPSSSFIIVKGEKSHLKSIKILGLDKEELRLRLGHVIDGKQPSV